MSHQSSKRDFVDNLVEDLAELEQRVDELEAAQERVEELEQRVETLDERTDMLRLIEESDQMDPKQRSSGLIQHAIEQHRNTNRTKIVFDRDRADEVLHYPDVERTTIYSDMKRCQRLIGDTDICEYIPKKESDTNQTELRFDFHGVRDVDVSTLIEGGE